MTPDGPSRVEASDVDSSDPTPYLVTLELPTLAVGARVKLCAPAAGLSLTSDLGTIVEPDQDGGYYVVRLDEPAGYDHGGPTPETLTEGIELVENLDVV